MVFTPPPYPDSTECDKPSVTLTANLEEDTVFFPEGQKEEQKCSIGHYLTFWEEEMTIKMQILHH